MTEISFRRRAGSLILPTVAFVLPPLAVFAPLGAAPLLVVAALASLLTSWKEIAASRRHVAFLALLLAALGLWGTLSGLWSIIPRHSVFEGARFLAGSAGGLLVLIPSMNASATDRRRIAYALASGLVLAILLFTIERFAHQPIYRWWHGASANQYEPLAIYDRGVIVLVLCLWPLAIADVAIVGRLLIGTAIIATAGLMASAAALLAAALGLVVALAASLAPRATAVAMIAAVIAIGLSIPLATPSFDKVLTIHEQAPWIKWSGIHRLLIWRFGADRVAERPLLGWGMDASRAIPGGKTDFNTLLPSLHYPDVAEAMPLHPHDAALQWQLELGIPGLLLGLGIVVWVIYRVGWHETRSIKSRPIGLALIAAALVVGLLSFGVWQAWWQSTLWLIASLYTASLGGPALPAPPREQRQ